MNLFQHKDNLLSLDIFSKVNATAAARYKVTEKEDTNAKKSLMCPIRSRERQFSSGHTSLPVDVLVRYGASANESVSKIREFLIEDCSVKNPEIVNIWFAYYTNDRMMGWHNDGPVQGFPLEHCITTALYIHNKWEPEWGGEIMSEDNEMFAPLPNRLVVWSRDVVHMVRPITNPDPTYLRMAMSTTWVSDGK